MSTEQTQQCAKKDVCGSCSWSDIPYTEQLARKVRNIVAAKASLGIGDLRILPATITSHYRNRMDFVVDYRGNFGLREHGKWWKVIDNHTCFLPDTKIIDLYNKLYPWVKSCGLSYYDRKSADGLLRYIVVRATKFGETMVIIVTSSPKDSAQENVIKTALTNLGAQLDTTSLVWSHTGSRSDISFGEHTEVVQGASVIKEQINDTDYIIRPNSFFQTNSYMAPVLQNLVLDMIGDCGLSSEATILDLYCGSGFFTLPLARKFRHTIGVESVESAIEDAEENARLNNLPTTFLCTKAENIRISDYAPRALIVDPPRAGLHKKVIEDILTNVPEHIVYVSCKYEKFFEEMSMLQTKYTVQDCGAVDMFPHTPHVELVTLLKAK